MNANKQQCATTPHECGTTVVPEPARPAKMKFNVHEAQKVAFSMLGRELNETELTCIGDCLAELSQMSQYIKPTIENALILSLIPNQ